MTKHVLIKRDNNKLHIKCSKGGIPILHHRHHHHGHVNYTHGELPNVVVVGRIRCDKANAILRVGSHEVPNPTMEIMSQLLSLEKPLKLDLDYSMQKTFVGLVLIVGSNFLAPSNPLHTGPKLHLLKVLPCRHPYHT